MVSRFQRRKFIMVGDSVFAALVGFCCGSTLTLQAAFHRLTLRGAAREAIKRPEKQNHCNQADRDVKAASHPASE
jgi:dienelactone hydrolase